jgi:NADH-quinone oxidoreductase subunit F
MKALLFGGKTGVLLSPNNLDIAIDYDSFVTHHLTMGDCSIKVLGPENCILDETKNALMFLKKESCGQCVFCREGTLQLFEILNDITTGRGSSSDIELLSEVSDVMHRLTNCNFGKNASNIVSTSINLFREEYDKHIGRKRCDALVCKSYITYHILPESCIGCGKCSAVCESKAILGSEKFIHVIDQNCCVKCGNCSAICPHDAIVKAGSVKPKTPDAPIAVGTWVVKKGLRGLKK